MTEAGAVMEIALDLLAQRVELDGRRLSQRSLA
jgi:hypothetical protein